MKKIFTRQLLALTLLCAFSITTFSQAETNTEFTDRMNYVFSPLEKNQFSGNNKKVYVNISNLPSDVYYIQIFDGKVWESQLLSIRH